MLLVHRVNRASAIRLIGRPARTASFRHRSINRNSAVASGSSFFNGWRTINAQTGTAYALALTDAIVATGLPGDLEKSICRDKRRAPL